MILPKRMQERHGEAKCIKRARRHEGSCSGRGL